MKHWAKFLSAGIAVNRNGHLPFGPRVLTGRTA
jgi:hypothetical protein